MTRYRTHVTNKGLIVKSNLEVQIAEQLDEEKVEYGYETLTLDWEEHDPRGICKDCGYKGVYTPRLYRPDFILENGVVIEGKGRLTTRDRKLLVSVRECNPEIDLRLCFARDNRLSTKSRTRYSEWAKKRNFKYCIGVIPKTWLKP